jgi:hypothetical protein
MMAGGAAAEVKDFAQYVPPDFMIYCGFPYSKDVAAKIDASPAGKMVRDPEYLKLLEEFFAKPPLVIDKDSPFAKAGVSWKDLLALNHGGMAFAMDFGIEEVKIQVPKMEGPPPDGAKPEEVKPEEVKREAANPEPIVMKMPRFDAVVYLDQSNPEVKALYDKLTKALDAFSEKGDKQVFEKKDAAIGDVKLTVYALKKKMFGIEGICVFEQGGVTVLASSQALAEKIIALISQKSKESLAASDLYTKAIAKLPDKRMEVVFFNIKKQVELAQSMLQRKNVPSPDAPPATLPGEDGAPPAKEPMPIVKPKTFGMESLQAIVASAYIDEAGYISNMFFYCPDGKFPLIKALQNARANFATLNGVTDKCLAFASLSLDPPGVYDWLDAFLKENDPKAHDKFTKAVQKAEKDLGVKIKDDILAQLDGEITIVMTSPAIVIDPKGLQVPVGAIIGIKDKAKVEAAIKKIYETAKLKPESELRGNARHQIDVLPKFALCVGDKYCVVAQNSGTAREILDAMDAKAGKIADSALFKKAQPLLGNSSLLFYVNTKDLGGLIETLDTLKKALHKEGAIQPEGGKPAGKEPTEVAPASKDPAEPLAFAAAATLIGDDAQPSKPGAKPATDAAAGDEEEWNSDEVVDPNTPAGVKDAGPTAGKDSNPAKSGGVRGMFQPDSKMTGAMLKLEAKYFPAFFIGVSAEKDGISVKIVAPAP